ncbi:MAG TPA: hypothetical protein VLT33_47325 [Labilithrix sp.]|nr:hypothetical protein [Labilithrix sp.]
MQNASLSAFFAFALLSVAACSVTTNSPDDRPANLQTPTTASGGGTCSQGSCHQECPAGQTCDATCSGGGCEQICAAGATCTFTCSGGGCDQACAANAACSFTCSGKGCARH